MPSGPNNAFDANAASVLTGPLANDRAEQDDAAAVVANRRPGGSITRRPTTNPT
jgi:hypothetical protein